MARMNPKGVLGGEKPRLIDEWQKAPEIWNQVKDDLDFFVPHGLRKTAETLFFASNWILYDKLFIDLRNL